MRIEAIKVTGFWLARPPTRISFGEGEPRAAASVHAPLRAMILPLRDGHSDRKDGMWMLNAGKIAYDAYFKYSGGKSLVSGAPLPKYEEQADEIKSAWDAAANAVLAAAGIH